LKGIIMTKTIQTIRAASTDLATLAQAGKARALAARMTELTAQEVQAVSGAAALALSISSTAFDDYCGTGPRPIPKLTGFGGLGGGVIVIKNGQYPNFNTGALQKGILIG